MQCLENLPPCPRWGCGPWIRGPCPSLIGCYCLPCANKGRALLCCRSFCCRCVTLWAAFMYHAGLPAPAAYLCCVLKLCAVCFCSCLRVPAVLLCKAALIMPAEPKIYLHGPAFCLSHALALPSLYFPHIVYYMHNKCK